MGAFWFRSPIGGTLYLRMRADGTWSYSTSLASPDGSPLSGTWITSGNQITVRETGTSLTGCTSTQLGIYRTSFDATCNVAVLTLVTDPCSLRATFMGGRSFNRITP